MANDFLFELGVEELPSKAVKSLSTNFATNFVSALEKAKLHYATIKVYATPRRIAILVTDLVPIQSSETIIRRGPKTNVAYDESGQPSKALLGFAQSCQVLITELSLSTTDKGSWFIFQEEHKGRETVKLLPELIQKSLDELTLNKTMRWGNGKIEFIRPVHWILMIYQEEIIPCTILGVKSSNQSYGHRFHAPNAIRIENAKDYESLLEKNFVIVDFTKRQEIILKEIKNLAYNVDATVILNGGLVEEVTAIVEWPCALLGKFDSDFLKIPQEVLIATLEGHQKCFALCNTYQELLPYFIMIANIQSTNSNAVIFGNERVIGARLNDAAFFFYEDTKQPLGQFFKETEKVILQEGLGSLADKTQRLEKLMLFINTFINVNEDNALRAVHLSKCDLVTGMVGEFPELQGTMGYYYSLLFHEDLEVAKALEEQYLPRFAKDKLPTSNLGKVLSLIDRIDTLIGHFALQQKPTGMKDPLNLYVAKFIGEANIFEICIKKIVFDKFLTEIESVPLSYNNVYNLNIMDKLYLIVRPEDIKVFSLNEVTDSANMLPGKIIDIIYKGSTVDLKVQLPSKKIIHASEFFDEDDDKLEYILNEEVWVHWLPGWEVLLPYEN